MRDTYDARPVEDCRRKGTGWPAALFLGLLLAFAAGLAPAAEPALAPAESQEQAAPSSTVEPTALGANDRQRQVTRMTARFVERFHYTRQPIDDEVSEQILENYLRALDGNRQYFLAADVDYFSSRYRHRLDDVLATGEVDPVFDIFRLYRLRAQQHLGHALALLDEEPDFTVDEEFHFDREEAPWITTPQDMQDNWRRRVKNDAISLLMADKSWDEAAEILRKRYERVLNRINGLDSDEVFETFMNAFARTLDPHSSYLSPRQSEEQRIQMSLSYQGIGASLQLDDDLVKILNIIPGGPAAIDGRLKANDRITGVGQDEEGEIVDVVGWQLDDVVQLIRGPQGTTVRLQILPANAPPGSHEEVLSLVRDEVKLEEQAAKSEIHSIKRDGEDIRLGVISLPSFYQDYDARSRGADDFRSTTRDVRVLLDELEEEGIDGLVIDLRGNGGGLLTEATSLTGLFVDGGPIVQLRDTSGRVEVLADPVPSVVYAGPLVVLVDRFSASASEIFSAAIQDYRRGIVIGQQTFGKGTVQNIYPLDQYVRRKDKPGLGQLTLTMGKFYRITGGSTQNRGVIPDISLPSGVDPEEIGENTREGALPWDQIRATRFRSGDPLDDVVAYLTQHEIRRMQSDPGVRYLLSNIEAAAAMRAKTSVSVHLEKRRAERDQQRDEQLARENEWRKAIGLPSLGSLDDLTPEDIPDVLLKQATQILGDYVALGWDERDRAAAGNDRRGR